MRVECEDCHWQDEMHAKEVQARCEDCGGRVIRVGEPENPDETISDTI